MQAGDKLRLHWSKREKDIEVLFPFAIGSSREVGLLIHHFCHHKWPEERSLIQELEARGYDTKTIKFSIEPKLPNTEKFPTLTRKYSKENQDAK